MRRNIKPHFGIFLTSANQYLHRIFDGNTVTQDTEQFTSFRDRRNKVDEDDEYRSNMQFR